jgi:hypothetical protein
MLVVLRPKSVIDAEAADTVPVAVTYVLPERYASMTATLRVSSDELDDSRRQRRTRRATRARGTGSATATRAEPGVPLHARAQLEKWHSQETLLARILEGLAAAGLEIP